MQVLSKLYFYSQLGIRFKKKSYPFFAGYFIALFSMLLSIIINSQFL
ncbi:hypothetical protein APHACPA_1679 [Rickettsia amblyommatis str. Ac/Pa]|uniref:Uncharacterized protein n=1 Tax=Rickettsia amblyommatis str. Ac/Pa TaxID=1359164 RepID=A0A0F3N3J2_RICAM|nr:hypothetical protein APHACPA_1679 [Rickettsia amblyommatis str. Ac/Pa]